jgi:RNA polymerase sigma-70 factor, ECF subfamily
MTEKKIFCNKEFIEKISRQITVILYKKFPRLPQGDKEDISQEVQLKIWKMIQGGRKIKNLESYLWKSVYTTALDFLDQNMEKISLEKDSNPALSISLSKLDIFSQEKAFEKKQVREMILKAVESLNPKRRMVMKLHLTGMNVREIAEFLDWSESRVNHLFYRGRKSLKAELSKANKKRELQSFAPNKEREPS